MPRLALALGASVARIDTAGTSQARMNELQQPCTQEPGEGSDRVSGDSQKHTDLGQGRMERPGHDGCPTGWLWLQPCSFGYTTVKPNPRVPAAMSLSIASSGMSTE